MELNWSVLSSHIYTFVSRYGFGGQAGILNSSDVEAGVSEFVKHSTVKIVHLSVFIDRYGVTWWSCSISWA